MLFKKDELEDTFRFLESNVTANDLKDWPDEYCVVFAERLPPDLIALAMLFAERLSIPSYYSIYTYYRSLFSDSPISHDIPRLRKAIIQIAIARYPIEVALASPQSE